MGFDPKPPTVILVPTPVDNLPTVQYPENKPAAGWQQPPMPEDQWLPTCNHMGRQKAMQEINRYAMGAEWVCQCGQIFIVAINDGGKRTLRKMEDVPYDD